MILNRYRSTHHSLARQSIPLVAMALAAMSLTASAQVTNVIPAGLFLTDDSTLFTYKSGQRLVAASAIEQARKAPECRPSDQDAEGHWGQPAAGFQLSLRLDKLQFAAGEPVEATLLIRNVSTSPLQYTRTSIRGHPSPIGVLVTKNGAPVKLKTDDGIFDVISSGPATILPSTQHKYRVPLHKFYDLSEPGAYMLQAADGTPNLHIATSATLTSLRVSISITNAPRR